jgi:pyruvate,water dikinase
VADDREEVAAEEAASPAVSDAEIAALVAMARRIAEAAGVPQDVEWAIERDGRSTSSRRAP